MSTIETIALSAGGFIATLGFAIIGFFLRIVHNDVRANTADIGKLKGKTDLIDSESKSSVDKLQETTTLQIQSLTSDIKELTAAVSHMNGNFKMASESQHETNQEVLRVLKEIKK